MKPAQNECSSSTGAFPGDELPGGVYRSVVFAFAWMMLAAWLAFGGSVGTDLDLTIASILCAVFLGIPFVMHRTATKSCRWHNRNNRSFLRSGLDTATGPISGKEAWLQVALIPIALALAATLIGGIFVLTS
jgi:hypothetical protein